jgi:hypothetical protein
MTSHNPGHLIATIKYATHRPVFQGLRLNVGKSDELTIKESLFTTFEVSNIFETSGPVAQVNLTPDQNPKSFP